MIITLKARWVLPIDSKPIEYGEVIIDDKIILEVRPQQSGSENEVDFGNAVIFPGFVNVHTHLELTLLRGLVEDVPFFPWIRKLTEIKNTITELEWLNSSRLGALEALASGITTVGDCTDKGQVIQACSEVGLGGIVYQEIFGLQDPLESAKLIADLKYKLKKAEKYVNDDLISAVSPHAMYTVRPELMRELGKESKRLNWKLAIHLAESKAETKFITHGKDEFAELYKQRNVPFEASGLSPTKTLARQEIMNSNTVLIHCIEVDEEDVRIVKEKGCAVAICPKSNAKLGNGFVPLNLFIKEGIKISIGTDSVASNNKMDLFEEMRYLMFTQRSQSLSIGSLKAKDLFRMTTLGGAEVLGLDDKIGSLSPGKKADVSIVLLDNVHLNPCYDPFSTLLYSASAEDISFVMKNGEFLYSRDTFSYDQYENTLLSVRESAERIRKRFAD